MKLKLIALTSVSFLLAGCELLDSPSVSNSAAPRPSGTSGIPTLNQDQPATMLIRELELRIESSSWRDQVSKVGRESIDMIPEAFREQQMQFMMAKPQAKFLVVDFNLKNLGDTPGGWPNQTPPAFRLVNSRGVEYEPTIFQDDLTQTLMMGKNINPGMSIKGRSVFDVPMDDYVLNVYRLRHTDKFNYANGPLWLKWILSPTEE